MKITLNKDVYFSQDEISKLCDFTSNLTNKINDSLVEEDKITSLLTLAVAKTTYEYMKEKIGEEEVKKELLNSGISQEIIDKFGED